MALDDRKTIDGKTYIMGKYMVEDGLEIWATLQQKFARPLGILVGGALGGMKTEGGLTLEGLLSSDLDIPGLLESLFQNLAPKEIAPLAKSILTGTKIQKGNELHTVDLNVDFSGNYVGLFKLLGAVLAFQYSDFFDVLTGKKGQPLSGTEGNRIKAKSI